MNRGEGRLLLLHNPAHLHAMKERQSTTFPGTQRLNGPRRCCRRWNLGSESSASPTCRQRVAGRCRTWTASRLVKEELCACEQTGHPTFSRFPLPSLSLTHTHTSDTHAAAWGGTPRRTDAARATRRPAAGRKAQAQIHRLPLLHTRTYLLCSFALNTNVTGLHFCMQAEYDPDAVYVRSTNIRRTIESARYVVTGMFGMEGAGGGGDMCEVPGDFDTHVSSCRLFLSRCVWTPRGHPDDGGP